MIIEHDSLVIVTIIVGTIIDLIRLYLKPWHNPNYIKCDSGFQKYSLLNFSGRACYCKKHGETKEKFRVAGREKVFENQK